MTEHQRRTYTTNEIITSFARQGTAIDAISRALVVPEDFVRSCCNRAVNSGVIVAMPPDTSADKKSALQIELTNVRAQLDDARNQLRDLREDQTENAFSYYIGGSVGLTHKEAIIVCALLDGRHVSKTRIYNDLYDMRSSNEQPDPKIIDVFMCKTRAKLRKHGVSIDTVWGYGYTMTPDNIERMKKLYDMENA